MKPITCILFGKSGSGKGTQAELLAESFKKVDPSRKTFYVETGQRFREFIEKNKTYTAGRVKEILANGQLLPAFLPVWIWTGLMIDEMKGDEHIVLDGLSRREDEAPILDSAMQFYGREKPFVLLLDVTDEEVKRRLLLRGRHDDKDEKIDSRLSWFKTDVMKAVHYFEKSPNYRFIRINGNPSIEKVHAEILEAIGLKG
jgi:adenylate kinase